MIKLLPFDYAARNVGRTPVRTVLTTLGAAAVVFLVILMAAFVESLGSTIRGTGEPKNAIILGAGSEDYLEQSEIGLGVATELAAGLDVIARQTGTDDPLISPEIHHTTVVRTSESESGDNGKNHTGMARGITPMAFLVHRQVFLKEGSRPPGPGEMVVGKLAATKMGLPPEAVQPGKSLFFEGRAWKIVGSFEAPGSTYEAELWVPLEDLKIQTKRDSLTCAVVRLNSAEDYGEVEVFTKTRLDLEIASVNEARYYAALAAFYRPVQIMSWIMAVLVVASGLFGGLNTMIAAIASRTRELACLETLGYRRTAILTSLLQESLILTGTGSLLAAGLSMGFLAGKALRVSMGALALDVGPTALAAGIAAGLFLAVAGTLIPGIALVRRPLVELLRG